LFSLKQKEFITLIFFCYTLSIGARPARLDQPSAILVYTFLFDVILQLVFARFSFFTHAAAAIGCIFVLSRVNYIVVV